MGAAVIAHCRHDGCRVEIVLTDRYQKPVCPEHERQWQARTDQARRDLIALAQAHDDDSRRRAQAAADALADALDRASRVGGDPPPPGDASPRYIASPVRRGAPASFWGDWATRGGDSG